MLVLLHEEKKERKIHHFKNIYLNSMSWCSRLNRIEIVLVNSEMKVAHRCFCASRLIRLSPRLCTCAVSDGLTVL